jgi:hypothetical protein
MTLSCLPIFAASAVAAIAVGYFLNRQPGLPNRTIDEVAGFLVDPDLEKLLMCLDPSQDELWRSAGGDRQIQRIRVQHLKDCLEFMQRNVHVLYEWGDREAYSNRHHKLNYDAHLVGDIGGLTSQSLSFLRIVRLARWKLRLRIMSRFERIAFMPVPRLAQYKKIRGVDLIEAYRAVAKAGEALASAHGDVEPIVARIRVCFWITSQ